MLLDWHVAPITVGSSFQERERNIASLGGNGRSLDNETRVCD